MFMRRLAYFRPQHLGLTLADYRQQPRAILAGFLSFRTGLYSPASLQHVEKAIEWLRSKI